MFLSLTLLLSSWQLTNDVSALDPSRMAAVQVTATRRAEATLDVPQAITALGRDEISSNPAATVMEALRGATGTYVQQTTPGQSVIIVRGLKGSEVLHLVDGFRLNNAIFRNAPNQYVALVDGQSLDRIEVVRGPSGALYGSDAMGGVVQMLTPTTRFEGAQWQAQGRTRFAIASADLSQQSRAELAMGRSGLAIDAGASYQDIGPLRTGSGERQAHSAFTARAADLKISARVAEQGELSLSVQHGLQPRTERFDELVPGFGQTQPSSSVFLFEPQRRDFAQLIYRDRHATPLWDDLEIHLGRQDITDDRRSREFGANVEDRERNRDDLTGLTTQFSKVLGNAHYLSYGLEIYRDRVASSRTRLNLTSGASSVRAARFPDGSRMDSAAVYIADDWLLGERWDLNLGARYSRFDIELPAVEAAPGVRLKPDDVSGNLGLNFRWRDDLRWVANVGRGFRAPNVFDLGTFGDRPGNRFNLPNPNLKPERVVTLDTGLKFAGANWQGELIAFRSDYRDKIAPVLTGAVTDSGRLVVQNQNATRLVLSGVEAGIRGHLCPSIETYASATWTRGDEELGEDQYPADRVAPLFGRAGVIWRAREHLQLEAYAAYATRQDRLSPRDRIDPRIHPDGTAGWATLNLRLQWQPRADLDLGLAWENLGDQHYREHGSGIDAPGHNASLIVQWRF